MLKVLPAFIAVVGFVSSTGGQAIAVAAPPATPPNLLVTGRVLSEVTPGVTAATDATVYVWWIPGLADAQVGDELPIESLAATPVGPQGWYSISVAPTATMRREAAANGGWLNFNIGTVDRTVGKLEATGISRRLVNGAWVPPHTAVPTTTLTTAAAATPSGGPEDPYAPASEASVTDLVLSSTSPGVPQDTSSGGKNRATSAFSNVTAATGIAYCSFIVDARPQRHVDVVEFHNATNSDARWTYGQSADSDIEGGIDYGDDGGWKIGATGHISNSNSAWVSRSNTDGARANNYGTTDFDFIDGHYQPYGSGTTCEGSSIPVNTKVKNPQKWVAGVGSNTGVGSEYIGCDQAPQSDHRTSYPVGSSFTRASSSASRIGVAVDLGPITTGAKSGYSTNMDLHWDSVRGHGIWLCGTNYDVVSAGVIHAQSRP